MDFPFTGQRAATGNVEEPEEVKSAELVGPPSGDEPPQAAMVDGK